MTDPQTLTQSAHHLGLNSYRKDLPDDVAEQVIER
jgi:hypothetical protein